MAHIDVLPVVPGGALARAFADLPSRIYRDDENFVPPFTRGIKRILARRHPYFSHSDGDFFVAVRDGDVRARIALLHPKRYNDYQQKSDARFYLFESFDDEKAARALFAHAEEWAHERGLKRMVGPQGFSGFAGAGILVDGFSHRATMTMMPYHKPYYARLVESAGFTKNRDFYSAFMNAQTQRLPDAFRRVADITRKRGNLSFHRPRNRRELKALANEIGKLYNSSWEEHDDFTPLTDAEMKELTSDLMLVTRSDLVGVVRHGDTTAGFALAFPDVSRALIQANGRLSPRTLFSIMREKHKTRHFALNGIGILPQFRRTGALALLFTDMTDALRAAGVQTAELVQIAETTDLMMSNLDKLQADIYKTHRVYARQY